MSRSLKISGIIGGLLVLLLLAGFLMGYLVLQNSLPPRDGKLQFSDLQNKVEITFDKMGIPQIWAASEHDAYFAFGYLHASDRMFQMDMTRRVAQGKLAELLGPTVLDIDIHQRTVGHDRIATKYLDQLSAQNRNRLEAYANGVNAYKNSCSALPFEFQLLGQDFADWTIFDCLSVMSFQTWFSDFLMSPDAFLAESFDKLGYDKVQSLNVPYPDWAPFCSPTEQDAISSNASFRELIASQIFKEQDLPFRMSNSSNSWVIAPHRSESGQAMLASDPHLEVTRLPQFWYQIGLHIEKTGTNAIGISTPGLPFITMGHNSHIAWAFTVSGVDVNEYYQEKFDPQDSTRYLTAHGWEELKVYPQTVAISGHDKPYTFDVLTTGHGPLVFENDSLAERYSLHWAGFDVDLNKAFKAGFDLSTIDNFPDFQNAVTNFGALDANWTYADENGNIGYQLGTPVAIRPDENINLPVPGWTDEFEWQGFYSIEKTPHAYNPARGWLASCNNKQDDQNLDFILQGNFASDRILRINQLLSSKEKFSVQDMYNFQMDTKDAYLLRWKDIIATLLAETDNKTQAEEIRKWDGSTHIHSAEAALVNLFLNRLRHLTFDDELGKRSAKILKSDLDHIWHHGPFAWFDNIDTKEIVETKEQIALTAIREAFDKRGEQSWGDFHTLSMDHPLSVVPILSDLLNLKFGPYPWAGTAGTLNASFYLENGKKPGHFTSVVGPSWRFVIDFDNIDNATVVLPAGNSGNPASEHYMDFFQMWKSGARWGIPTSRVKVENKTINRMILEPVN